MEILRNVKFAIFFFIYSSKRDLLAFLFMRISLYIEIFVEVVISLYEIVFLTIQKVITTHFFIDTLTLIQQE